MSKVKVFKIGSCRTCLFRGMKICNRFGKRVHVKRSGKWGYKRLKECKPDKYVSLNEVLAILKDHAIWGDEDEFGDKYVDHIHHEAYETIEKEFTGHYSSIHEAMIHDKKNKIREK